MQLNRAELIDKINTYITTNGNNEITGAILNDLLKDLGDSLANLTSDEIKLSVNAWSDSYQYSTGDVVYHVDSEDRYILYVCINPTPAFGTFDDISDWNKFYAQALPEAFFEGAISTVTNVDLPVDRVLISDGSGKINVSDSSATSIATLTSQNVDSILIGDGVNGIKSSSNLYTDGSTGDLWVNNLVSNQKVQVRIADNSFLGGFEASAENGEFGIAIRTCNAAGTYDNLGAIIRSVDSGAGNTIILQTNADALDSSSQIKVLSAHPRKGIKIGEGTEFLGSSQPYIKLQGVSDATLSSVSSPDYRMFYADAINESMRFMGKISPTRISFPSQTEQNISYLSANFSFRSYLGGTDATTFGMITNGFNATGILGISNDTNARINLVHNQNTTNVVDNPINFGVNLSNTAASYSSVTAHRRYVNALSNANIANLTISSTEFSHSLNNSSLNLYFNRTKHNQLATGGDTSTMQNIVLNGYHEYTIVSNQNVSSTNLIQFLAAGKNTTTPKFDLPNQYGFFASLVDSAATTNLFGFYCADYARTSHVIPSGQTIANVATNKWQIYSNGSNGVTAGNYFGNLSAFGWTTAPSAPSAIRGIVHIGPNVGTRSSLLIESSSADPTSPIEGQIWIRSNKMYIRLNSLTREIALV